jgi:uncharacterized membrane protein HdeD (DUF308 family)
MTTTDSSLARSALSAIRLALGISGAISLIVGILILVWPGRSAMVVTAIVAIYAIAAGLVYAAMGVFSRSMRGWARVGHVVLGVLFVVAGILAFANLAATTEFLAVFVGVFVGILWIMEGVVALSSLGSTGSRGWAIFFAIVSIVAGVVLVFSPGLGAAVLWLLLGISLIVLGVAQIVRAITLARGV